MKREELSSQDGIEDLWGLTRDSNLFKCAIVIWHIGIKYAEEHVLSSIVHSSNNLKVS